MMDKMHNSKILEQAVTRAIGRELFLSLVSPVLFLIIGTIAVFMNSDGKYPWEIKQLNKIDKMT